MIDPDLVLSYTVDAFRSIPALVLEMGNSPPNIYGHYFLNGAENSLDRSVIAMSAPSILVAYTDLLWGNFDGMTVWKHRLEVYIRPKNAATGHVGLSPTQRARSPL